MPVSLSRGARALRRAPSSTLPRVLCLALSAALCFAAAAGCDDDPGTTTEDRLAVTLYHPAAVGLPSTSSRIDALRISVFDRDLAEVVGTSVIAVDDEHGVGRAPDLPFGDNLELHVEAVDGSDRVVAYGGSAPFDVIEGEAFDPQFVLFMSENNSVSPLSAVFSNNTVLPSPFIAEASEGRAGHTATTLDDGRVLVIGGAVLTAPGAGIGASRFKTLHGAIEVYDPRSGYFDPALDTQGRPLALETPRVAHEALRLADGRILVIGGLAESETGGSIVSTTSVELITPQPGGGFAIGTIASLNTPRAGTASVVRDNGNVIVTGGYTRTSGGSEVALDSAELLDLGAGALGVFLELPATMSSPRFNHTATDLGTVVFLAGGSDGTDALGLVEIFSPAMQTFVALPSMTDARHSHSALRLARDDGRYVVVAGGHPDAGSANVPLFSFEIFDTERGVWATPSATIGLVRRRASFDLVELANGSLLAIGGLGVVEGTNDELASIDSVELLVPAAGEEPLYDAVLADPLQRGRFDTASARLPNGMVIITGGARFESGGYASFPLSDIYNPGPPPLLAR